MPMATMRLKSAREINRLRKFMSLCIGILLGRGLRNWPCRNYCLTLSQAIAGCNHMDLPCLLGARPHNQQGHATKRGAMVGVKRLHCRGITVVHGSYLARAGHF